MERILKTLRSRQIKSLIYYVANYLLRIVYIVVSVLPVKQNRVLFLNYNGKGYGDNPKYVADALNQMTDSAEMVWIVSNKNAKFPDTISSVKMYSLKGLMAFAASKVWISNCRMPFFLYKKRGQRYFQLWHGGCGPKKVEGAAEDKLIRWYVSCAKHDSKMADYFVSNSRFNSDMIRKYFWYDGKILDYGSPRHDIFFKDIADVKQNVLDKLGVSHDYRLILYAPTFRDDKNIEVYQWEYGEVVKELEKKYNGKWKFVLRLHPNISFEADKFKYSDSIINGSIYDDMQELIMAADVVITDYSGVMMQAAIARKFVLLLIPDRDRYLSERGLCLDINEMPFPKAVDVEGLCSHIKASNLVRYGETLEAYLERFEFYDDGHASQRVVEKIKDFIT